MMNPSCTRSATTGVEYCLPDLLPVCRIAAAYQFFRPASVPMTGLRKYLVEIRTARSSGRGQVPGASATSLTIRAVDCGSKTAISGYGRWLPQRAATPFGVVRVGVAAFDQFGEVFFANSMSPLDRDISTLGHGLGRKRRIAVVANAQR